MIDKILPDDCKRKHKNFAMAWVDYKKAYDMVPHSWIIQSLKMAQIAENIADSTVSGKYNGRQNGHLVERRLV